MRTPFTFDCWRNFYRRHRRKLWLLQVVILLAIGYGLARSMGGMPSNGQEPSGQDLHAEYAETGKIWTCSMHPQIRRDEPGKCPLCGMDLVPVKKSTGGVRTISISPDVMKLMNVQTVPVTHRYVTAKMRMVGKVNYDETRLSHMTAWVSGRLDRLYIDYTGIHVEKGDHMAYIYSEELYSAQEELIQALKYERERPATTTTRIQPIDLAASAREKLHLLGLTDEQIEEIEQRGTAADHITIYAPLGGVVIEKLRQLGDRVRTGDRIYTVADLKQVWVKLDAYESDLQWLRFGQRVEFTTEAYPGEKFTGRIAFIDPVLNEATRTVKVRVNVPNEDGRLKPEMFVSAVVSSRVAAGGKVLDADLAGKWISPMHPEIVKDEPGNCDICGMPLVRAESLGYVTAEPSDIAKPLVIPVSAALLTGTRAIVYVQIPNREEPTYEGREIVLGPRAGDYYLVKSGVKEGELVVTNGSFKLDSALQISAKPSMMTPEGGGGSGHHHGGESKAGKDGESMQMTADSGMSFSPQLKEQLHQTIESVDKIGEAVESGELDKIRWAFAQLGPQVAAVHGEQLSGDMKAQWQEFAMLLRNDSVEGKEITALQNADRIYLVTKRHAERLQEMFGLSHAGNPMEEQNLEVPAEFRSQLHQLIPAYLSIGYALSADDAGSADQVVAELHQAVNAIDSKSLEGKASERWKSELNSLSTITARLSNANDLASLRSAFALLSDELLTLQRTFGFPNSDQLFELHCPMAFEGRGASWIQSDDAVRNPYYGASMLKCADQIEPLGARSEAKTDEQSGHDHGS